MSKTLLKKLVQKYQKLSLSNSIWVKRFVFPVQVFHDIFNDLCFDVYQVSGERQLMFITSAEVLPYFIKNFCNDATITKTGEIYAWNLKKYIRKHDAVIIEMPEYLKPFFTDGIITVRWIRQELNPDDFNADILKHIRERKKIFQFQPEFSTDMNEMKMFYEKIYRPYLEKRYKYAKIEDFELWKQDLLKYPWELLVIEKNGIVVGGGCSVFHDGRYRQRITALLDEGCLKEGAMAAIYYYSILRAKEKNVKIIDFGLSRPFLSDGVLINKRKWRAKIVPSGTKRIIYLKNLKKEGLIIVEEEKLKVIIFSEKNAKLMHYSNCGLELKIVESGI